MMLTPQKRQELSSAAIAQTMWLVLLCSGALMLTVYASDPASWKDPAWWTASGGPVLLTTVTTNSGVVTTNSAPYPDAVVNQGQLKFFTARAVGYLNSTLPGGAGVNLNSLVQGWARDYATNNYTNISNPYAPYKPSDYSAMTVGQLKYIAGMVYGQLGVQGYSQLIPTWVSLGTNDTAAANLGQLKQVFDFDLSLHGAGVLTAIPDETGDVNLNWTLPSTNYVNSWLIEEQSTNGAWNILTNIANPTATSYSLTGLISGNTYKFQVIGEGTNSVSTPVTASGTASAVPTTGLALWLRADTGVTTTGGVLGAPVNNAGVSSIADATGNFTLTESSTNYQPTYIANDLNGKPGLRFDGAQTIANYTASLGSAANADMTIVTVGATTNYSTFSQVALSLGPNGAVSGANRVYSYYNPSGTSYGRLDGGGGVGANGSATPTGTGFTTEIAALDSAETNIAFYQNGNETSSAVYETFTNVSPGITMGSLPFSTTFGWQGDIVEQMVYDRQLSTSEVEQVEVYLANKYALALNLPPRTITPNGGSFTTSQSVAFSSVPAPAVIRYTLDGTNPSNTSTLYSGAFTVSGSYPLTAAVFLNGRQISADASAQFYVGDTSGIGISDAWQIEYFGSLLSTLGLGPNSVSPGGLTYMQDYLYGYNPTVFSSNGDGLSDLINYQLGYAGTDTDINGYGLSNAQQIALGLDPFDTGTNPSLPTGNPSIYPVITLTIPTNATPTP